MLPRPRFQVMRVRSFAASGSTVASSRKSQWSLAAVMLNSSSTISSASPARRPVRTPARKVSRSPRPGLRTSLSQGRMAFQAGWASMLSTVSKACGVSSGPGRLCTFRPLASVTAAGTPVTKLPGSGASPAGGVGGVSSAKASCVSAATPGFRR